MCTTAKTLWNAQTAELKWAPGATGLLVGAKTDVDKSGKSYYGSTALHFLSPNTVTEAALSLGISTLEPSHGTAKCCLPACLPDLPYRKTRGRRRGGTRSRVSMESRWIQVRGGLRMYDALLSLIVFLADKGWFRTYVSWMESRHARAGYIVRCQM